MTTISSKGRKLITKSTSSEPLTAYKLSTEQLRNYHENGFLLIKRLIDPADLNESRNHFINICNGSVKHQLIIVRDKALITKSNKQEDYINKLNDIQFDETFMTYTEHPKLLGVIAQLLGEELHVVTAMFINKPPGSGQHCPHQDLFYTPFRPADKIVGAWTAIDEATVDNGCLWVVPQSHKVGKLYPHDCAPGTLKLYHSILDDSVSAQHKRIYLEMAPGDTLLFHPLLVHGSGPNITQDYRKSISAHYMSSECVAMDMRGTEQEGLAIEVEQKASKRGLDIDFSTISRNKSKLVRSKSKL